MKLDIRTILVALAVPARLALGFLFIWASLYKIAAPHDFALSIATYDIMPLWGINLMAIVMPWLEVIVGLLLIIGLWIRPAALAVCGMMIMFCVALTIALMKDLQMSCGCFSSASAVDEINSATLIRDFLWLAASVFVLIVDDGRFGLDGWLKRHLERRRLLLT